MECLFCIEQPVTPDDHLVSWYCSETVQVLRGDILK